MRRGKKINPEKDKREVGGRSLENTRNRELKSRGNKQIKLKNNHDPHKWIIIS